MQAPSIIKCPKCGQSLMAQAVRCQFCGDDLNTAVRPAAVKVAAQSRTMPGAPAWVWPMYTALCVWYMVNGGLGIWQNILNTKAKDPFTKEVIGYTAFTYFGIAMGVVTIIFGILLLARVNWVRGVVNFFAGLSILFNLIGLPAAVASMFVSGLGVIIFINTILALVTNVLMIYLIGETDKHAW